jgi:hypothetical protein
MRGEAVLRVNALSLAIIGVAVVGTYVTGCAANSTGILPYGPDEYVITTSAGEISGGVGAARAAALTQGAQFCAARNKQIKVLQENSSTADQGGGLITASSHAFANGSHMTIQFTCVQQAATSRPQHSYLLMGSSETDSTQTMLFIDTSSIAHEHDTVRADILAVFATPVKFTTHKEKSAYIVTSTTSDCAARTVTLEKIAGYNEIGRIIYDVSAPATPVNTKHKGIGEVQLRYVCQNILPTEDEHPISADIADIVKASRASMNKNRSVVAQ